MFSVPSGQVQSEGDSDANPVHLEQVASNDFERLLMILYPLQVFSKNDRSTRPSSWGEAEWMSVLSLADKWQMSNILNLALENLRDIVPATTKILFGQRYDYPSWVLDGFVALCAREHSITEEEGQEIGMDNLIKCAKVREELWERTARASYEEGNRDGKHRRVQSNKRSPFAGTQANSGIEMVVRDVLGLGSKVSPVTGMVFGAQNAYFPVA
ncbi:hypothetical protein K439DRAFT_1615021 [Ramaria rubella]|nr:hypothetical protein K439DRAFT_1615021 [Ramaria rubella]